MKGLFKFSLVLMAIAPGAFADEGLDRLRNSFDEQIRSSSVHLDRASEMKVIPAGLGVEISHEACQALAAQIKVNYKIDPFVFSYQGGRMRNFMCGGRWEWQKNYIRHQSGETNLGLPYSRIIQVTGSQESSARLDYSNYFIDSHSRIVEIQGLAVDKKSGSVLGYGITSVNQAGDVYMSVYEPEFNQYEGWAEDVVGIHQMQRYMPADGSAYYPLARRTVKHPTDPSKDFQSLNWYRSDWEDWQDFQLPITYAFMGGFYLYDGKWYKEYDKPEFKSNLTIKYRGGKEYCAYGHVKTDVDSTRFPDDSSAYAECVNY